MPISMYDQPAQAQFINTYVPLPFNEIAQAGLARQGRYDTNLSAYEQAIADVESMKAIPTSEDERRLRDAAIGMRETADTYAAADYSNPEVVREIAKKTRGIISRRDLADIQSSHASWQQNEELKRKLRAAGQYQPWLDEPYKGYDTRSRGVYSFQTPGAVNFRQAAEQYFNNIKDQDLGIREDKYGAYMQSGITQGTINKVIDEQYRSFLGTEAGRQAVQEYRYRTGDTQSNPEQVVKQMLADVGKEFIRTDRQYIPGTTGSSGKQPSTPNRLPSNQSEAVQQEVTIPIEGFDIDRIELDENGQIKRSSATRLGHALRNFVKTSAPIDPDKYTFTQKDVMKRSSDKGISLVKAKEELMEEQGGFEASLPTTYEEYKSLSIKQQRDLDNLISFYPSLEGLPKAEALSQIKLAKRDLQNTTLDLTEMSNLANENLLADIVNNKRHRTFMILDGDGSSNKTLTGKGGVLDVLGMNESEFDEYLLTSGKQLGGFTQDGPEAGMYYVEVPDKKGEVNRRVLISSNENIKRATASSFGINQMINTMGTGVVQPGLIDPQTGREIGYYIQGDINNGQYNARILVGYIGGDSFEPIRETSLTEIKNNELEALTSSNYVGTEFGKVLNNKVR